MIIRGKQNSGTYDRVLKRMLDALPAVAVKLRDKVVHPLANFNRAAQHDFTLSLLSSWAVIADIVNFYRDRISEEGYLASTREDRSVYYLSRLLGYEKWRGEAAATWLALTVSSTQLPQQSAATGVVSIPAGGNLVVQNIPSSGAQPVIFESHDDVEARVEWNDLHPFTHSPSQAPSVFDGMTGVRLAGQLTSLRPGSPLLIQAQTQSFFRSIDQVQVQQGAPFTFVTWSEPLKVSTSASNQILSISTFRQQAGLFGRKAAAWNTAPDSVREKTGTRAGGILSCSHVSSAWRSVQSNLPPLPIQALSIGPNGHLLAGTSKGLYAAPDSDAPWTAIPTSPAQQSVLSILVNHLGYLYIGGTRGAVSLSTDNGQNWQSLRGSVNIGNGRLDGNRGIWAWIKRLLHIRTQPSAGTPTTSQPPISLDGVIRVLAEYTWQEERYLLAGTDRGIFFLRSGGLDWTTYSEGLAGYNHATGLCSTAVLALCPAPSINTSAIYAATESGLYFRKFEAHCWKQIHLPGASIQPRVFALVEYNRQLFAGTSQGLYSSSDGKNWQQASGQHLPATACFRSLAPYSSGFTSGMLAGTDQGAWYTIDGGTTWTQLACQQIHAFCLSLSFADELDQCDLSPVLLSIFAANEYALPEDATLHVVTSGSEWNIESPSNSDCFGFSLKKESSSIKVHQRIPLSTKDVRLVATRPTGEFLLASPTGPFLQNDWPGFHLCSPTIALDRIISDLQPGTRVILHQDQPQPVTVFANIEDVEQRPVQAWGRQATVSVLTLSDICGHLELLRQRDVTLYCKPSQCTASDLDDSALKPVSGDFISINKAVPSLKANTPIAVVGKPPSAVLPQAGGVFLHRQPVMGSQEKELPFTPHGLSQENVSALAFDKARCWAFAEGVGLYYRAGTEKAPSSDAFLWKPAPGNDAPVSATSMLWLDDALYVATENEHLYRYKPHLDSEASGTYISSGEWTQDISAPANILSLIAASKGVLYAGTKLDGVYKSSPERSSWSRLGSHFSFTNVRAFAVNAEGTLYAGGAEGVFAFYQSGAVNQVDGPLAAQMQIAPSALLPSDSVSLDIFNITALDLSNNTLYAGTAQGEIFSLQLPSGNWSTVSTPRLKTPISSIVHVSPSTLLIGTQGQGLCRLTLENGIATPVTYSASNDITALLALPNGTFLASASNTTILAGNNLSHRNAQRSPLFLTSPKFADMLDLQAVPPELVAAFQRFLPAFANPRVSTVTRGQCWVIRASELSFLLHLRDGGLESAQIAVEQIDTFSALSREKNPEIEYELWILDNGFQSASIKLLHNSQEMLLASALPGVSTVGEIAKIGFVTLASTTEATQLTLTHPLHGLYDADATSLNANLAYATQGVTVPLEILGSGKAATTNQHFQLRRPPVTYARSEPHNDPTCSLQIHVSASSSPNAPPPSAVGARPVAPSPSGVAWKQVPSFFNVKPGENAYTFTIDAEGNNIVQFGDGIQGSRLPTGIDNVAASYRTGLGEQGNIHSGSLVVFRKRPLGIRSVSNPVPATGGSKPESASVSRARIRLWTFALDRIVSLRDYENFCLAKSNILKAQVTQLPPDTAPERIRITLANRDRRPLNVENAAYSDLLSDIQTASARAYPFAIDGFDTLYFQLELQVTIISTSDRNNIRESIFEALLAAFSFDKRSFAQGVTAAEIIALIQALPHIEGVNLLSFHLRGELPAKLSEIKAERARWDVRSKRVLPAQLLLFDPNPDAIAIHFADTP